MVHSTPQDKNTETTIFLMPSLFNQTVKLLLESRHYFSTYGKQIERDLPPLHRAQFAREMSRITIRLSCIMAWLAVQKAVISGEMTQHEAEENFALDGMEYGLTSDIEAENILPETVRYLLEQSLDLYERVHRLSQAN